jgi:hypothetical protein
VDLHWAVTSPSVKTDFALHQRPISRKLFGALSVWSGVFAHCRDALRQIAACEVAGSRERQ